MDFFTLPDRINFSHVQTFTPLLFRFEGGNDNGGFCYEEFKGKPPFVSLHGDLHDAREVWARSYHDLSLTASMMVSTPATLEYYVPSRDWFLFDYHGPDYRLSVHQGNLALGGSIRAADRTQFVHADISAALKRIEQVFRKFYNV